MLDASYNPLETGHVSDTSFTIMQEANSGYNPLETGHVSDISSPSPLSTTVGYNPLETGHVSDRPIGGARSAGLKLQSPRNGACFR